MKERKKNTTPPRRFSALDLTKIQGGFFMFKWTCKSPGFLTELVADVDKVGGVNKRVGWIAIMFEKNDC